MNDLLSSPTALLGLIALVFVTSAVAVFYFLRNRRNSYATPLERATFGTLHTVALAAPSLREGLSPSSAALRGARAASRRRRTRLECSQARPRVASGGGPAPSRDR